MASCFFKAPLISLLHYEVQRGDDKDLNTPNSDDIENEQQQRIIYERQLSKEISISIGKTRKEMLLSLLFSIYPSLNIPMEILILILDYEQDDSLFEVFKIFDSLKTSMICQLYPIPWLLGCTQMLIFGYLASEHWKNIKNADDNLLLLQCFGIILCIASSIQMIGCYFCITLNVKKSYLKNLINLKCSFFANEYHSKYDILHYMKAEELSMSDGWELFIPFQKWTNCLRIQNVHNVRNEKCLAKYILFFHFVKPFFCFILGIQLVSLSPHCLVLWLLFFLYFSIFLNICVFSKSPLSAYVGCTIFMAIISITSIRIWPNDFESGLRVAFEIFIFLIFLLYLFSLYLICCSGHAHNNGSSANMLGVWLILFACYCMWIAELMEVPDGINYVLMFSIYLLYIAFQMLLLTSCDLQTVGINCAYQIQFIFVSILFGWLCDLDVLMNLLRCFCRQSTHKYEEREEEREEERTVINQHHAPNY